MSEVTPPDPDYDFIALRTQRSGHSYIAPHTSTSVRLFILHHRKHVYYCHYYFFFFFFLYIHIIVLRCAIYVTR